MYGRMKRTLFVAASLVVVAASHSAMQQPAVDLTGTWIATDAVPPSVPRAPAPPLGDRFALKHAGDNLTLTRVVRAASVVVPYVLDGREVRVRVPGGLCIGDSETVESASRDGDAIVLAITGATQPGGGTVARRDIRRTVRQPDKDTLIVEARMVVQGEARPVATVYKRSTDTIPDPPAVTGRTPATIAQAAWIGGVWTGTEKTTTVEERWTPPSGGSMLGTSRTMANGAMSAFEFLCIVERGGTLVYQAMPNGRSPATDFTATAVTADSITFENPSHDYPKVIRYAKLPDGSLQTTISAENGQRARSFVLKKQE